MYFSDNPQDGHTVFPRANLEGTTQSDRPTFGTGPVPSMADCDHGFASYPVKGRAIMWYNLKPIGMLAQPAAVDYRSLHGACPLHSGIKMGANHWIHNVARGKTVSDELPKQRVEKREQLFGPPRRVIDTKEAMSMLDSLIGRASQRLKNIIKS